MNSQVYQNTTFLTSAAKIKQLPADEGYEVAFAGRSNAGKSSALNCLTNQKRLAKTSKTPGRTQLINLFEVDSERRIVDLPGYGYAKVPEAQKIAWQKSLTAYFESRRCLKGIILLMDIRHPLKPIDTQMIEWSATNNLPIHILLTKADKLKRGVAKQTLLKLQASIKDYAHVSIQLFSSQSREGLDNLCAKLDHWFELED